MEEQIMFKGHKNIRATHKTTLEITKDEYLTPRGDCIIGVNANKACCDLSASFKNALRNKIIKITLIVDNYQYTFNAYGYKDLKLKHKHDIVIRKSNFICDRTLCIKSEKAAIDLPREMIQCLRSGQNGIMILSIE